MIANQVSRPVDDHTGLQGRYDISLSWSDDGSHAASHPAGGAGALDHDHGAGGGAPPGVTGLASDSPSGPTLIGAVQAQLGLKLEPSRAPLAMVVVDSAARPSAN